jgi:hypothetical protein
MVCGCFPSDWEPGLSVGLLDVAWSCDKLNWGLLIDVPSPPIRTHSCPPTQAIPSPTRLLCAPPGNSAVFPSAAISAKGKTGVITFTLSGPDFWPSPAFVVIKDGAVKDTIYLAALSPGPADNWDGYSLEQVTSTCRWGDYSAARVDEKGNFWFAAEYIDQVGGQMSTHHRH